MQPTLHENTPYSSAAADEAIATRAMCDTSMETSSSRGFSPLPLNERSLFLSHVNRFQIW